MTEAEKKKMRAKAAKLSRPSPVELPSGMWRCQVTVNGKRESVIDADPTIAHAKALALKNGLAQRDKPRSALTVLEATNLYIESKNSVLSPSTIGGYERVRDNLMDRIAQEKLYNLTQEDVQRWVNQLARDKSPKTVRNAHGLLTAVVSAYRPELALRTTLPQKRRYDVAIPSEEDINKIIAQVRGTENEIAVLLAIWLGLRMSEVLGLKWSDIDGDVVHIRRARVDEGEKTTKTYSSQRDLPLPPYIKRLLDTAPKKGEYIVPIQRKALYSRFQTICKHAEVSQHYRFHDLRHINASVMLALGVPNKYAQQRMGHATENMLKTVYQHTMSKEQKAVADKVDDYFNKKIAHGLHTE
jgi:integrase